MITRCLNKDLSKEQGQRIHQERMRINSYLPADEIVYIPVAFHFISSKTPLPPKSQVTTTMHEILDTLNHDYGRMPQTIDDLLPRGFPLLRDGNLIETMRSHLSVAGCPNIQFVSVREPPIVLLSPCDMKKSDLSYWDDIIKLRTSPAYNPASTLNLWVIVNTTMPFLGYSQFPEVSYTPSKLAVDGVVIVQSPPPYHLWKTASHEVGHFFGLQHTFYQTPDGRFDDGIADTPFASAPSQGSPLMTTSWPTSIEPNGVQSKHMFVCIMDYTNDDCLFMFTKNQCELIRGNLASVRKNWILKADEAQQVYQQRRSLQSPKGQIIWSKFNNNTNFTSAYNLSSYVPRLSPAPFFFQSPFTYAMKESVDSDKDQSRQQKRLDTPIPPDSRFSSYTRPTGCLSLFCDAVRLGNGIVEQTLPYLSGLWD